MSLARPRCHCGAAKLCHLRRMRIAVLPVLFALAACAGTPHAWQNPATGELAPAAVIDQCQAEAQAEAQRSMFLNGWVSPWMGFGWSRGYYVPGWGFGGGWSSFNMAMLQRAQELTAFCMRIRGYAWLPLAPTTGKAPAETPAPEAKP